MKGVEGPIAVDTRLGWVLSGPAEHVDLIAANLVSTHTLRVDYDEAEIDKTLKAFWDLESLGVKDEVDPVQDQFT